uniref:Uncharacterized protein n=1 Tax=Peronospora matthiolae TaxID=2874970 RepID=A0AAV1UAU3_9STRA
MSGYKREVLLLSGQSLASPPRRLSPRESSIEAKLLVAHSGAAASITDATMCSDRRDACQVLEVIETRS